MSASYAHRPVRMLLQETVIELASWRETQIASVDFTNLTIKERVCETERCARPGQPIRRAAHSHRLGKARRARSSAASSTGQPSP